MRGRVVREYVGAGEKGQQAEVADQAAKEARGQAERQRADAGRPVHDLVVHVRQFDSALDQLVISQLVCAGWRRNHRQWKAPKRWH